MKNIPYEQLLAAANHPKSSFEKALRDTFLVSRLECNLGSMHKEITRHAEGVVVSMNKVSDWLRQRGYIIWRNDVKDLTAFLSHQNGQHMLAYLNVGVDMRGTISIDMDGDEGEIEQISLWFEDTFPDTGSLFVTIEGFTNTGSLIRTLTYVPLGDAKLARQSFYPWLSVSLEEYFEAFFASPETVLVMFGPPGTGKSTFLRSLIASRKQTAWLAYTREAVTSAKLVNTFLNSEAKVLAYEDIDKYLGAREDGNDLMSTLLNASDGVVQHPGKKIIFSTNLSSIDRIDPALLRVGRCFDILQFQELSQQEALRIRSEMNLPERDFSSKNKWSLADAMALESNVQQTINRFGRRTGFV